MSPLDTTRGEAEAALQRLAGQVEQRLVRNTEVRYEVQVDHEYGWRSERHMPDEPTAKKTYAGMVEAWPTSRARLIKITTEVLEEK